MSKIEIKIANDEELQIWDRIIDQSPNGTLFHKINWLKAAEKQSKMKLFPLIGYQGQEIIGVFPLFYMKKFSVRMLFSPPPGCAIPHMGPVYKIISSKQSHVEKLHKDFVASIFEFIVSSLHVKYDYVFIETSINLLDMRSFIWRKFDVRPRYTYVISTEKALNDIKFQFSQSHRKYLEKALRNPRLKIEKGRLEDVSLVCKMVSDRYREQGIRFGISDEYLLQLYGYFHDNLHIVKLHYDDEFIAGILFVQDKDTLRAWLGTAIPTVHVRGANIYLHWWGITYAKEHDLKYYDLMGANFEQLCQFKSRFNPTLQLYFRVTKKNVKGAFAEYAYETFKGMKSLSIINSLVTRNLVR